MPTEKKRILFIAHEMSPYLELSEVAELVNKLAVKSNETGMEVRVIMPRFGVINERRHRLHEVVRLSGINVIIDNDDFPLIIKVASLPNARLQVYFMDNEDYFKRKTVFHDDDDAWYADNANRMVFFCKSALETVKKFGWPPDLIVCSGWMSALVPMYLKTAYKKEPVFAHAKSVYLMQHTQFKEKLGTSFLQKARISNLVKEKDMEAFQAGTHAALNQGAARYADAVIQTDEKAEKKLLEELQGTKGKKVLAYSKNSEDLEEYMEFFEKLLSNG